ncbi:MAG: hydrogenase nickel incorporation protein HypA/HybF [Clostridia bacterium]|nr:hydrogenase nickel incorporation protein HypA/HybF [Clostridia bacterium]
MHELSLAEQAVRLVSEDAEKRGIRKVKGVKIVIGQLTAVVPEAFRLAFQCAVKDTVLAGATLVLEIKAAEAVCSSCGEKFQPQDWILVCPRCSTVGAHLLAGNELEIVSYEGEGRDEDGL